MQRRITDKLFSHFKLIHDVGVEDDLAVSTELQVF